MSLSKRMFEQYQDDTDAAAIRRELATIAAEAGAVEDYETQDAILRAVSVIRERVEAMERAAGDAA